jgi:ComF family protein
MPAHDLVRWISDLLWPLSCLGCHAAGARLCQNCLDAIDCSAIPQRKPFPHIDALLAPGTMRSNVLVRAIWHLKYRHAADLALPLGEWLGTATLDARIVRGDPAIIIPVPLHSARLRERGYNQAALLANHIAAATNLPLQNDVLIRRRHTPSQVVSSGRMERLTNMRDAFVCPDPARVRGRTILLIDDVCTTGATLSACAQTLKRSGAHNVLGIVLAR